MNKIHVYNFCSLAEKFEREICNVLKNDYPRSWDENTLSYNILSALRNVPKLTSSNNSQPSVSIKWDAFKFTGKIEQQHGDIAVIVVREAKGRKPLTGVGFLEAKKRDNNSGDYIAIKTKQLSRILKKTPYAYVLLYDYEAKPVSVSDCIWCRYWDIRAFAVPANLVLALNTKKSHLVEYGLPLSYVLCFRFFQGYDLDFDREIVQKVLNRTEEFGGISYMLVATIGEVADDQIPQPNDTVFARLE